MGEHPAFLAFCERFGDAAGDSILDRIDAAHCSGTGEGVSVSAHQHNACNYTLSGTITHSGEVFGFVIDSGDWNGTVIRDWGASEDVGDYKPEPPTVYTFVPLQSDLAERRPGLFRVFMAWRNEAWFKDKVRGYNYDRHFAPGIKTEQYYRDWAAGKGLKIVSDDDAKAFIAAGRVVLADSAHLSHRGSAMTVGKHTAAELLADRVLRASGSGLRHYTMHSIREAIIKAAQDSLDEQAEATRASSAKLVADRTMVDHFGRDRSVEARMALAIAANDVRRGRYLTEEEKLANLSQGMADTPEEEAEWRKHFGLSPSVAPTAPPERTARGEDQDRRGGT